MIFNSLEFLLFFTVVTIGYFALPYAYRWLWLLVASSVFYMAFVPVYILILGFTIVIDYIAGIWIENARGPARKRLLLLSLVANIGVLAVFKYYNFFNENLTGVLATLGFANPAPYLSILLPIGLSFHTFQAMSYTIEVYQGNQKAERHFGIYALYVMFYPQLVAGPIERPQNILHQFYEKHQFDYQRVTDGLKLMAWGMFKKVVIADQLASLADVVYNNPTQYTGLPLWLATGCFGFQIYCDFSAYSDMALGAAQVMGFRLMQNFDRPYFSKSIAEFWRRWHSSLSTWFRDYVYIPLGGNRVSVGRQNRNLFLVFLLSGLWHGASWNFVIWGALHGTYLVVARVKNTLGVHLPLPERGTAAAHWLGKVLRIGMVFGLVNFAWIFFRAATLPHAWHIVTHLFTGLPEDLHRWLIEPDAIFIRENILLRKSLQGVLSTGLMVMLMEGVHLLQRTHRVRTLVSQLPALPRWGLYYGFLVLLFYLGAFEVPAKFIYFQF